MALYLVRFLTPLEFGLYGIGFAISLFYSGIGVSLFHTQMVVHVPDKALDDRLPYAARIFLAIVLFCFLTTLFAILTHFVGKSIFLRASKYVCLIFPITAVSISFLFKEFFVRHSYTAKKEVWVLYINITVSFSIGILLLARYYSQSYFSSETALFFYAISNLIGAVIGFFLVRLPIGSTKRQQVAEDIREAWQSGRWAIGASSVLWLQSQAYTYLTALFLGPVGVGYANAGQLLIKPFLMLLPAVNQVSMPVLAELRNQGAQKLIKVGLFITIGLIVLAVLYAVMVISFSDYITQFVLGAQFKQLRPVIIAWMFVLFLQLLRDGAENILQAMKRFRALMVTYMMSAWVTVIAVIVLLKPLGVQGSILGTGIGEILLAYLLWRIVWNERHKI